MVMLYDDVSCIAQVTGSQFSPYYSTIMPGVKSIIAMDGSAKYDTVRGLLFMF